MVVVRPPSTACTVYRLMAAPPVSAGWRHAMRTTPPSLAPVSVAVTAVGAEGLPTGITDAEAGDHSPGSATLFVARTRKVYS